MIPIVLLKKRWRNRNRRRSATFIWAFSGHIIQLIFLNWTRFKYCCPIYCPYAGYSYSSTLNKGTLFTLNFQWYEQSIGNRRQHRNKWKYSWNFELADYEVLVAKNGKQGVEMATMNLPDIILWYNDARSRRVWVLYLLNKNPETTTIPFILLLQNQNELICVKEWKWVPMIIYKTIWQVRTFKCYRNEVKKKRLSRPFYSKSLENLDHLVSKKRMDWLN
jgi:hypothetical protein